MQHASLTRNHVQITGAYHMDELTLLLVSCLSAATMAAAVAYYRQLRKAQREYEKAKGAVEYIILSFNRQFKREGENIEALGYKVEAAASKTNATLNIMEGLGKRMSGLEEKVSADVQGIQKTMTRVDEVDKTLRDMATSHEAVLEKVANLEQAAKQLPTVSDGSLEVVIPIRREKAMAQLTHTEVSVLEMLVSEGSKTAPEIKERVKLSREHTARLMKKLYEEGYLERETGKIPFKYSVKKEMEKLLRKTENQPT